jgi:hypothetical protein
MKKSVAMRWVKALRSGKYKQGAGSLRQTDKGTGVRAYCCLGVLCDVTKRQTGGAWTDDGTEQFVVAGERRGGALPEAVAEYAGTTDWNPTVPELGITLADLNDGNGSRRKTFKQIARIIEKHWEKL